MLDLIEDYYYHLEGADDLSDAQRARRRAFSLVLPVIIENELTQRQRICLSYKYVSGKSQQEIASIVKLSQPTVSRHINSAKEIVNNKLKYCYAALAAGLEEYDKTA